MKVLIVDSYYPRFLQAALPEVTRGDPDYESMLRRLLRLRFGTSDFYSRHLRELGIEAADVIFNCEPLQQRWAKEHGGRVPRRGWLPGLLGRLGRRPAAPPLGLLEIATAQIRHHRPDVLYLQDLNLFPPGVLRGLKDEGVVRLVVGQIACPLPPKEYLEDLDLIVSSFPHYVRRFREEGKASAYLRIAFDPVVLEEAGDHERDLPCTFVGGLSPAHGARTAFLERLAREVDMSFYGYGAETLAPGSPIAPRHRGEAWALDMYRVLLRSRITVNVHIDVAENYANNMRLYEATGCAALLVTDMKDNLAELFEPDREVLTYESADEAVEKIRYCLDHPAEAESIAAAGQARTLREHTYGQRMAELAEILAAHLTGKGRGG